MKTFRESLQNRDFVLTAELNLERSSDARSIIDQASVLTSHTDAIQVPDSPAGRVQMTPLAASRILLDQGIESIAHLSCRDRNRVALESELLSLGASGVNNLLLLRGEELPEKQQSMLKPVFELGGKDLIETARSLAEDPTVSSVADFCIGTVATVFSPKKGWKPRSLLAKVDAGASFIQTQPCFDVATLKRYMNHLVEAKLTWRCAIIVSVATLPTAVTARWLRENLRGSLVPKKVVRRLEQARDPEQEGVAICAELLQQLSEVPGVSGAHLMTPGDPATITAAIQLARPDAGKKLRHTSVQ
jgi:methylenetetrahydrofolate reductase (NADPH)